MTEMSATWKLDKNSVLEIVNELIARPSINPGGDEYEVAQYIKTFMEQLEIPVTVLPISERRFNIIARIKGSGEAEPIAFTGHMDVVPVSETELEKWNSNPFQPYIKDGILYGRGAADMKGGLGAAMAAMRHIKQQQIVPPGDVVLIATVDEEDTMRGAKAFLQTDLLQDIKNLVICEPSDMKLMFCSKGRTWADITVTGESGHASIQGNGNNAIMQAMKLMQAVEKAEIPFSQHEYLGNFFWQIPVIHGGIEPAMVPDTCVVTVDARLVPGQRTDEIWAHLERILERLCQKSADFHASVEIIEKREPWETSLECGLAALAKQCCQDTGIEEQYAGFIATTDGTVFTPLHMDMLIMGPGSLGQCHQQNESVAVEELQQAAEFYLTMMLRNNITR